MNWWNQFVGADRRGLDQKTLSFWHNFYLVNLLHNSADPYDRMLGVGYFQTQTIEATERYNNYWANPATASTAVNWISNDYQNKPDPTISYTRDLLTPVTSYPYAVCVTQMIYPRDKYKPRRTYWTGKPLPRRNLK